MPHLIDLSLISVCILMHGKAEPVAASRPAAGARAATKEQLRIAQVTNQEGQQDEDRSRIQKMIKEV